MGNKKLIFKGRGIICGNNKMSPYEYTVPLRKWSNVTSVIFRRILSEYSTNYRTVSGCVV